MYAYRATLLQLASQPTRLAYLEDILPRSADVDAEVENTSASSGFSALRAVAQRLHPHSSFVVSKYDKEGLDFCAPSHPPGCAKLVLSCLSLREFKRYTYNISSSLDVRSVIRSDPSSGYHDPCGIDQRPASWRCSQSSLSATQQPT